MARKSSFSKRLIVACAVFRRDRWESVHHTEAAVGGVRPKRRFAEIRRVLEAAGGFGLVSYADTPTDLIARANYAWPATVLAAVGAGMALVQVGSGGLADVELFFDTKDLAAGDRRDFEQVLRETLPELAVEAMAEFGPTHGITNAGLRFQRIEAIQKPKRGAAPSALQRGTNLAHHLCAQSARVIATGMSGRILARDNTTGVCEMLEALRRGTLSPSTPR